MGSREDRIARSIVAATNEDWYGPMYEKWQDLTGGEYTLYMPDDVTYELTNFTLNMSSMQAEDAMEFVESLRATGNMMVDAADGLEKIIRAVEASKYIVLSFHDGIQYSGYRIEMPLQGSEEANRVALEEYERSLAEREASRKEMVGELTAELEDPGLDDAGRKEIEDEIAELNGAGAEKDADDAMRDGYDKAIGLMKQEFDRIRQETR